MSVQRENYTVTYAVSVAGQMSWLGVLIRASWKPKREHSFAVKLECMDENSQLLYSYGSYWGDVPMTFYTLVRIWSLWQKV